MMTYRTFCNGATYQCDKWLSLKNKMLWNHSAWLLLKNTRTSFF